MTQHAFDSTNTSVVKSLAGAAPLKETEKAPPVGFPVEFAKSVVRVHTAPITVFEIPTSKTVVKSNCGTR